ncbi:MAG: hypothetical protein ABR613_06995 [Actinomycetota bacterium]
MESPRRADDRPTPRDWVRYWFDNRLASGTAAMVFWLAVAAFVLIVTVSALATIANVQAQGTELTFGEALWRNLMRTLDPGTMGEDVGWPLRVASLTATLGGVLIISSLFATFSHGIRERAAQLKRRQSPVIASGHTLVLGWSPKIFPLVSQLFVVKAPKRTGAIVVLAPLPKDEMERQIKDRLRGLRRHQRRALVLRTGRAYEPEHLDVARPHRAGSTVILNPGGADGDAEVVRSALALLGSDPPPETPLIAEICNTFTAEALERAAMGGPEVRVVRAASFIARMTAQVCRQPGLSTVYQDVLQFDGNEIYFASAADVAGRTFGEALLCYENAALLGIKSGREIALCPPMARQIGGGDEVIAIAAEKTDVVATAPRPGVARPAAEPNAPVRPETVLMIGWNEMAPEIIRQLDRYLAPGSTVTVRTDSEVVPNARDHVPKDLAVVAPEVVEEALSPEKLRALVRDDPPDHVILLCYKEALPEAEADARVLLTLLHLRNAIHEAGADTNIVVELLDERDVKLTEPRPNDEFIVTERLTALLLAQYSENPDLEDVFDELLEERGAEVYLKPARLYAPQEGVAFADVVAVAAARGEIALGYETRGPRGEPQVTINPPKGATVDLRDARVVVLAQEEA